MINLSPAVIAIRLMQRPVLLNTPSGSYQNGKWVEEPLVLQIMAAVQAASQQDLVQYADRDKIDGFVRIYTETELRTVDEDLGAEAQSIGVFGPNGQTGKIYRIVKAGRRDEAGFTRAIGRLQRDTGRSV